MFFVSINWYKNAATLSPSCLFKSPFRKCTRVLNQRTRTRKVAMHTSVSNKRNLVVSLLFCLFAALLLTACGSTPGTTKQKDKAVSSLDGLIASTDEASAQTDAVMAAATSLVGATDLAGSYKAFANEVEDTKDLAQDIKEQRASMEMNSTAYIESWRSKMAEVQDAELRASATERAQAVHDMFKLVREKADAANTAYTPFVGHLTDLEAYLNNDLTPAGVKIAQPVIKKVGESGQALNRAIADYQAELKKVKTALSSGTPETPPGTPSTGTPGE